MRTRRFLMRLAVASGLLVWGGLSAGCATSRGTLDVRTPVVANPAQGPAVRIVRVTDGRRFELRPRDPSIPSLKDGQIDDPAITSRAIARKRNTYGKAMGDILLPAGRTVEELTEEALRRGLRESGFRVLREGDSGYDDAAALEADIHQFWAWISPGFWAAHLEFNSRIRVTGPIKPFDDGKDFKGYVRLGTQAATGRAWLNTIDKGLENLNDDMKSQLREVAPSTGQ
jgi:hypothetical protein